MNRSGELMEVETLLLDAQLKREASNIIIRVVVRKILLSRKMKNIEF